MTEIDYYKVDAINRGFLADIYSEGIEKAIYNRDSKILKESKAFRIGKAVHLMILEPEKVATELIISENTPLTKAGKAEIEAASKTGKIWLHTEEFVLINKIKESFDKHELIAALLEETEKEAEMYFKLNTPDADDAKVKVDAVCSDYIVELKTTSEFSSFEKDFWNYNYDLQAAFYLDAFAEKYPDLKGIVYILIETEAPFQIKAYFVDIGSDHIKLGRKKYMAALDKLIKYKNGVEMPLLNNIPIPPWQSKLLETL